MFQLPYQRVFWDLIFSWEENELATKEHQKKRLKKGKKKKVSTMKVSTWKKQQQKPTQWQTSKDAWKGKMNKFYQFKHNKGINLQLQNALEWTKWNWDTESTV